MTPEALQSLWLHGLHSALLPEREVEMNRNPTLHCLDCSDRSLRGQEVVRHRFVGERMVKDEDGEDAYEQVFACNCCGTERRFGYTNQRLTTTRYKGVN